MTKSGKGVVFTLLGALLIFALFYYPHIKSSGVVGHQSMLPFTLKGFPQ